MISVFHADESGVPDSKETVEDQPLHNFEWVRIDGTEIELTAEMLSSIYERCSKAKRSVLKYESAFSDYTAEYRKGEGCFRITRRGNGYA